MIDYKIAFVLLALVVAEANFAAAAAAPISDLIDSMESCVKDGHTRINPEQLTESARAYTKYNLSDKMAAAGGIRGLVRFAVLEPIIIMTGGNFQKIRQVHAYELARLYVFLRPMFADKKPRKPLVTLETPKLDVVVKAIKSKRTWSLSKDDYKNLVDEYHQMELSYKSLILHFDQERPKLTGLAAYFNHPIGRVIFPIVKENLDQKPEDITDKVLDALSSRMVDI